MTRWGRIARWGRLAMWVAAYALVFQAFATGVLVSAMPIDGTATPLCLSATSSSSGETSDRGGKSGINPYGHCTACLVRADLSGLPPPLPTPVLGRVALELEFRAVVRRALDATPIRLPIQARAPPHLA